MERLAASGARKGSFATRRVNSGLSNCKSDPETRRMPIQAKSAAVENRKKFPGAEDAEISELAEAVLTRHAVQHVSAIFN